jgi:hypothetical protein
VDTHPSPIPLNGCSNSCTLTTAPQAPAQGSSGRGSRDRLELSVSESCKFIGDEATNPNKGKTVYALFRKSPSFLLFMEYYYFLRLESPGRRRRRRASSMHTMHSTCPGLNLARCSTEERGTLHYVIARVFQDAFILAELLLLERVTLLFCVTELLSKAATIACVSR